MGKNLKTSEPEEILRKGLSQLQTADDDIPVPGDLSRMLEQTVDRELGRRRGRMRLVASISSVAAAAATSAPKSPRAPKSTKSPATHPPFARMIVEAIAALKEKGGSKQDKRWGKVAGVLNTIR